jgi:hypothetical protein
VRAGSAAGWRCLDVVMWFCRDRRLASAVSLGSAISLRNRYVVGLDLPTTP